MRLSLKSGLLACLLALALGLGLGSAQQACAQTYPNKPVRIVIASTPASGLDAHARLLADSLAALWKQSVLVDYKPGGAMAIGANYVAKSPPDGYTLFFSIDAPFVVNPLAIPNLPYKIEDFAPVSFWSLNPFVLVVNADLPVKSVRELVSLIRERPGKLNAASASATTLLSHELFKSLMGGDYATITYRGGTEAIASLVAGETQFAFYDISNVQAMITAGKLRVLAQTPAQRASVIADIPTIAESGVPGFETGTWGAVFAPAGTPREIIDKLNADIRTIVATPEINTKIRALGVEPRASSPQELLQIIETGVARWDKLIRERNIKLSQ